MIDPNRLSLIPAADLLRTPALVPPGSGVYMIFFDCGLLVLEKAGYFDFETRPPLTVEGFDLLYVGATSDHLQSRALAHLKGNSLGSSLRMTVGAVMARELSLDPVGDSTRTYFNFGEGEGRLTSFMTEFTRLAFITTDDPFGVERKLIEAFAPPFNISEQKRRPFSRRLMTLRALYAGRPKTGQPDDRSRSYVSVRP